MEVCVLTSGSSGNSTFIKSGNHHILIDAGTNYNYLCKTLKDIDYSIADIDYIFISHTHSDHIGALQQIINKHHPIICLSEKMLRELVFLKNYENLLISEQSLQIDDIQIDYFKTSHDTADSRGFIISSENKSVVYVTDTGYINSKYFSILKDKELYIMESNHDPELLINGKYPKWLQMRILSDVGHLSNESASLYLSKLIGPRTKKIILAHLSKENNTEEIALKTLKKVMKENDLDLIEVIVAKQEERTELIKL